MDPVKLSDKVEVFRSLQERKKGPKFYLHAKRSPLEAEVSSLVPRRLSAFPRDGRRKALIELAARSRGRKRKFLLPPSWLQRRNQGSFIESGWLHETNTLN